VVIAVSRKREPRHDAVLAYVRTLLDVEKSSSPVSHEETCTAYVSIDSRRVARKSADDGFGVLLRRPCFEQRSGDHSLASVSIRRGLRHLRRPSPPALWTERPYAGQSNLATQQVGRRTLLPSSCHQVRALGHHPHVRREGQRSARA